MATPTTPNYGLNLPDGGTLNWDTPINQNFTIIDTELEQKAPKAVGIAGTITTLTAMQYDSVNQKYQIKTRTLAIADGVVTVIGAESAWTDVPTI